MNTNWKLFFILLILALAGSFLVQSVSAANYYVQQGDYLYVNDTVDISGIAAGTQGLAYYGLAGVEDIDVQYLLKLPKTKAGFYSFYLDPEIFGNRTGTWFKWNGAYEKNGNTVAFKIKPQRTATNASGATINISSPISNVSGKIEPAIPLLPYNHVADYLVARGDDLMVSGNGVTSIWIFGIRNNLLDYHTFNNSLEVTAKAINTLSPGSYTLLMQQKESGYTGDDTVRYDNDSGSIQWFDPSTFTIQGYSVLDQTPENILNKLKEVFPVTHNTYTLFTLEVQDPTISIDQIDALNMLNDSGAPQNQGVIMTPPSYLDIRGYTNVAPDTLIKVVIDPQTTDPNSPTWKNAMVVAAVGDPGGEMREWKALIPIKFSDLAPGRHFVFARTELSDEVITSADFYRYEAPAGNVIPNKTIKYISGRYGPEEMVPTPTPLVITNIVKQTVVVTQTIIVPVTPSNEQVKSQQDKVISEKLWFYGIAGGASLILLAILGYWGYSWIRGRKKKQKQPKKSEIDEFLGR